MSTQGCSVPVGCVLAYAGQLKNDNLKKLGWSICDGASLLIKDYQDLFTAIGAIYGGDSDTTFNIPDYQGYFLRGVDPDGSVDKEAVNRTPMNGGTASGAVVGSVEQYYTAAPQTDPTAAPQTDPFYAPVEYPYNENSAGGGGVTTGFYYYENPPVGWYNSNSSGGDSETRPTNAAVNFIIKICPNAVLPTGAVIAFAGNKPIASDNRGQDYLLCNGSSLKSNSGQYLELYQAIGTAHGGVAPDFNVPDYRGQFLRGLDNGKGRDREVGLRTPMAHNGAGGDAVGSIQGYATALPQTRFHIAVPAPNWGASCTTGGGWNTATLPIRQVEVVFTASGGNRETRPVNKYVDFYILAKGDENRGDIFPIGAIIGFPGNQPPSDQHWLECRGQTLGIDDRYPELFSAIQHDNGGDTTGFDLPDYRGYFLRGTDRGSGRDPNAGNRTLPPNVTGAQTGDNVGSFQSYATARPKSKDITGTVNLASHSDTLQSWDSSVRSWGDVRQVPVSGGDQETCPINANILFYIKYQRANS
jgi:microcystin-dependent protein